MDTKNRSRGPDSARVSLASRKQLQLTHVRCHGERLLTFLSAVSAASLWLSAPAAFAADEVCASCSAQVTVSGDFAHRKSNASVAIESAGADAAAFSEDINGTNFTVTIAHLPAGRYTISIG